MESLGASIANTAEGPIARRRPNGGLPRGAILRPTTAIAVSSQPTPPRNALTPLRQRQRRLPFVTVRSDTRPCFDKPPNGACGRPVASCPDNRHVSVRNMNDYGQFNVPIRRSTERRYERLQRRVWRHRKVQFWLRRVRLQW